MDLYLVKLGGSVITDIGKPNTPDTKTMNRVIKEIKSAVAKNPNIQVIVGHGSGSFAHIPAKKYRLNEGLTGKRSIKGAAITSAIAANLHRIVITNMIAGGLNPFSFPPSAGAVTKSGKIENWDISHIKDALGKGFVPVTCGDVTMDVDRGIAVVPTEEPLEYIASKMKPTKVIIAGDVDGVFTSNPKLYKDAALRPVITQKNIKEALKGATGSTKIDVTGGMHDKLQRLWGISKKYNTECHIINAKVPNRLYSALVGEKVIGTRIKA
jgi:isopentenyl phosphate kinase